MMNPVTKVYVLVLPVFCDPCLLVSRMGFMLNDFHIFHDELKNFHMKQIPYTIFIHFSSRGWTHSVQQLVSLRPNTDFLDRVEQARSVAMSSGWADKNHGGNRGECARVFSV